MCIVKKASPANLAALSGITHTVKPQHQIGVHVMKAPGQHVGRQQQHFD